MSYVLDGDSFNIEGSSIPIRMIGINTNETSDDGCHAGPAKMRLRELIEGKTVTLSADDLSVVFPGATR